jgi:Tol biopolymer transport system component/DNA-binding winged helix-turn-helix (wHTH) protein
LRIQEQPFQVLTALVTRPNEVVSREELRALLWPDGTFVDYERGLNAAVARLRQVLQDSAENPRFIETVARRGYRFIAPLNAIPGPLSTSPPSNGNELAPMVSQPVVSAATAAEETDGITEKPESKTGIRVIFVLIVVLLGALVYRFAYHDADSPVITGYTQLTNDARTKSFLAGDLPVIVTDGSRVYFTASDGPVRSALYQVSQSGGETSAVPTALDSNVEIGDISPDRSRISLQTFYSWAPEMPLWTMPVTGGAPTRLHDLSGRGATWSPDGRMIAFAKGNGLYVSTASALNTKLVAAADTRIRWARWAPDGKTLRYTVGDANGPMRIEAASIDGGSKRPLLPGFNKNCCCGNWTADAKYYVFECHDDNRTDLWAVQEERSLFRRASEPVRLTRGPIEFRSAAPSSDGKRLYALGVQKRGQLVRYDVKARRFVPYLGGISARGVAVSRDGQWYAYISHPDGTLWRSRRDGSERLRLTMPPMHANLPQWSPDGRRIAFASRTEGQRSAVYLVSANGGLPERVLKDDRHQSDPSWSPDGESLAFGRLPWLEPKETISGITVVNLKTKQTYVLPGSKRLYSPHWSPDGRYMQALTAEFPTSRIALFDFSTQRWKEVSGTSAAYPNWSRDGKYVHFISPYVGRPRLCRLRVSDRSTETIVEIDEQEFGWSTVGKWTGLAADDSPLVLRDTGIQEIYALDWRVP